MSFLVLVAMCLKAAGTYKNCYWQILMDPCENTYALY